MALAVRTSGRTVLLAGLTVCVALLGQFLLGVSFLYGVSVSAAIAVALTMATAITLLPAMLGFLGPRCYPGGNERALAADGPVTAGRRLLVRLGPVRRSPPGHRRADRARRGSRAGAADLRPAPWYLRRQHRPGRAGPPIRPTPPWPRGSAPGSTARSNWPPRSGSPATPPPSTILAAVARTPGVASVTPAVTSPNGQVRLATVYPSTGPQDSPTVDLVNHIRRT